MGIRISEMEEATTFGADDYVPIVSSGTNKKALGTKIKDFMANYFVKKTGDTFPASSVTYDNTTSGLTAANAQGAIDEVNEARYQIKSYNSSIPVDNMYGNNYSGVYWMAKPNWSGMPSGSYGYLEIVGNLQKFYPYALNGRADIYVRMFINNTWNEWKRVSSLSDASISRASGVSSSVQLPGITRRGNTVIIHFATQLPAGTYYNLYTVTPKPIMQQHCMCSFNNTTYTITVLQDGTVRFNNSVTTNSSQYIIGQLVYLTDE